MEEIIMNDVIDEEIGNDELNEEVNETKKVNIKKIAVITGSVIGGSALLYGAYRGVKALVTNKKLQDEINAVIAESKKEIEKKHEEKTNAKNDGNEPRNREERRAQNKNKKK